MRRARGLALIGTVALALAGCRDRAAEPAAKQAAAPASGGLIDQVVETPEGGFRMGSPTARVTLVEYGSYTCPHCAVFWQEAMPDIRRLVAGGTLSFEYRPYAREVIDLTAALVARCAGARGFFRTSDQIFDAQQEWVGNAQNMTNSDMNKIDALPTDQQFRAIARGLGLNSYAGTRGGDTDRCLTDPQAIARVVAIHDQADRTYGIRATPLFLLNGEVIRSADWKSLKARIEAPRGG